MNDKSVQQHPDVREVRTGSGGFSLTFADPVGDVKLEEIRAAVEKADAGASDSITVVMHPSGDIRQVLVTFEPPEEYSDRKTIYEALDLELPDA